MTMPSLRRALTTPKYSWEEPNAAFIEKAGVGYWMKPGMDKRVVLNQISQNKEERSIKLVDFQEAFKGLSEKRMQEYIHVNTQPSSTAYLQLLTQVSNHWRALLGNTWKDFSQLSHWEESLTFSKEPMTIGNLTQILGNFWAVPLQGKEGRAIDRFRYSISSLFTYIGERILMRSLPENTRTPSLSWQQHGLTNAVQGILAILDSIKEKGLQQTSENLIKDLLLLKHNECAWIPIGSEQSNYPFFLLLEATRKEHSFRVRLYGGQNENIFPIGEDPLHKQAALEWSNVAIASLVKEDLWIALWEPLQLPEAFQKEMYAIHGFPRYTITWAVSILIQTLEDFPLSRTKVPPDIERLFTHSQFRYFMRLLLIKRKVMLPISLLRSKTQKP